MLIILNRIIIAFFLFSFTLFNLFKFSTRYTVLKDTFINFLNSMVTSKVGGFSLFVLFTIFFIVNLRGNIPLNSIPTLFYSQTLTVRLLFWIPIIICVSITQFKEFIAHILPYGSPIGLILFLPLVEIFSQLIRPLTLIIRLRTNLSSGHIMIYIFRYFTLLSSSLSPFIYVVLYALFVLELCISMLQAYIFVSLLALYINETVYSYSIINILVRHTKDLSWVRITFFFFLFVLLVINKFIYMVITSNKMNVFKNIIFYKFL